MYRKIDLLISLLLCVLCLTGCIYAGGVGQETGEPPDEEPKKEGKYLDSAVEGLNYRTDSLSGITDEKGTFEYRYGETIKFLLGDVVLGQATAKEIITPIDLVDGATDETDSTVTNICRFIQSLDVDGNLNNGITITDEIRNEVDGRPIDFSSSIEDFESDYDVQIVFDTLNTLGAFYDGDRSLRSVEEARDHLRETLDEI